jgi:lipopolysaccharide heptosyltransferase I
LRVLIVRLGAIGDVVLNTPVLCALRERFPQAYLAWTVEAPAAPLLAGHRALDRLIVVPRGWLKSWQAVRRLRSDLRTERFDIALDLQGLTKSSVAAWLSGAPRRIGFATADFEGRELSPWLNTELVAAQRDHVVERGLELLQPLGIEAPTVHFDLNLDPLAVASAEAMLASLGLGTDVTLINPGAGWPSKIWPAERFAAVARHLGTAHGLPSLIVWAGQSERQWAEEIVAGSAGHARLAPATSLVQLAALTRQARLFVSSDTGPLHIAAANGTPCVGLYGPMSARRCGPYGKQHIALQTMCLNGSSRARRTATNESMCAISIETVCEACDQILARRRTVRCA